MGNVIDLDIVRADLLYQAYFAAPSIRILTTEGGLYDRLLGRMLQYGAGLRDLNIQTGVQSIADASVSCWLFQATTLVTVRADRFEIFCSRIPEIEVLSRLILQVLEAVKESEPRAEVRVHSVALNLHVNLGEGISCSDFISQYVKAVPDSLGPASGLGFVWHFPGQEERQWSSIRMEPSQLHPGALYARGDVTFDAKRVSADNVTKMALEYFQRVAESCDLRVKR